MLRAEVRRRKAKAKSVNKALNRYGKIYEKEQPKRMKTPNGKIRRYA